MSNKWFEFRRFPSTINLSKVNTYLNEKGVPHYFSEDGGEQVLWLAVESHSEPVGVFIDGYINGEIEIPQKEVRISSFGPNSLQFVSRAPLTFTFIVLGLLGYILASVYPNEKVLNALIFWPFHLAMLEMEVWRLITPVFLHFSIAHYVFNAVWIFLLGQRLELMLGRKWYTLLFVVTSIGGNAAQYYITNSAFFGGLSGVVYGYVGAFCVGLWCYQDKRFQIQPMLLVFSLVAMGLGFVGIMDWMSQGGIANWAHLGGLISGALFIAIFLFFQKVRSGNTHV